MSRVIRPVLFILLLCCALLATPLSLAGSPPVERTFIEVEPVGQAQLEWLLAGHFDLAGENSVTGAIGLIVTSEELARIDAQGLVYTVRGRNSDGGTALALSQYTDPVELEAFVDQMVATYPDLIQKITLTPPGEMWEGHHQYLLKITKNVAQANDRVTFIFDAQHHAREVMTPEIARDMIEYLLTRYETDTSVQEWVDNVNIYIVPCENPDGSMFVFTNDSYWRRNRHPACAVDPNRNYPFLWNGCNGSSGSCTSDTNRGSAPASEPETQGMLDANEMARALFALTYHTYGEYIMYSYGCSDPDEMDLLEGIAQELNAQLENDQGMTGQYRVGPIWSTIYEADGGSLDTQYAQYGTNAFVIEANSSGFQPDYDSWRDVTVERQRNAWRFFLDKTLHAPQIRGKVSDAYTGDPLEAEIAADEVVYTHGEFPRHADSRGLYHWLAQANHSYHLTWSLPGYCSETREVNVADGPVEIDLQLSYPLSPDDLAAEPAGDNAIHLSWSSPAPDIDEFWIYRSKHSGAAYTKIGSVLGSETEFLDTGVSGGVNYFYVVRSFKNCTGHDSNEVVATTTGDCHEAPEFSGISSVSNAGAESCTLDLSWPEAHPWCGGLVTYELYRSTTLPVDAIPENLITAGVTGGSWTDHDALASGSSYHYLVRSTDSISGATDGNQKTASGTPTGPDELGTFADDAGDNGEATLTGEDPWSILETGGHAGPRVYATGHYANDSCTSLTSAAIRLDQDAVLSFHSKYDIETDYDAGRVEVSTGPDFDEWFYLDTVDYPEGLAHSGNACGFPTGGTNTVFSLGNSAPEYGSSPFTGSLAAYNDQEIRFRFRLSTDGGATNDGWWVDDLTVTNAWIPGTCASGLPPAPMEASAAQDLMTCIRATTGSGLVLDWVPACGALDHVVYQGRSPIMDELAWTDAFCGLGTTGRASFDPGTPDPGTLFYFVIAGQNDDFEGSYGKDSRAGTHNERPEASGIGACDKTQQIGTTCP